MHRFLLSVVAVAALAAGAAAQPQPVWEKDFGQKAAFGTQVIEVGFAPDGRTLVALTAAPRRDGLKVVLQTTLRGYDTRTWAELYARDVPMPPRIGPSHEPVLAFVTGDRAMVVGGGTVTLRGCRNGQVLATRHADDRDVVGVWVSGDGRGYHLLTHSGKWTVGTLVRGTVPDAGYTGRWTEFTPLGLLSGQADEPVSPTVAAAAVSPDGTRLAAFEGAVFDGGTLAFSGLRVAGGRLDLTPESRVVVPGDGLRARPDTASRGAVTQFQFSPDGRTLAAGTPDGELRLWDVPGAGRKWVVRATVTGPRTWVSDVAFRPDSKVAAFCTTYPVSSNVWLVDVPAAKVIGSFSASPVATTVAFSSNGKLLATGSHHGRLEVWDVEQVLAGQKK